MALPPKSDERWYLCEVDDAVVVIDLDHLHIVARERGPGALKTALRKACNEPLDRRPRRPATLGVERDDQLAALKGLIPGVAFVLLAERPALVSDALALASKPAEVKVPTTAAGARAAVARIGVRLWEAAPWRLLADEAIPVEAPALGLERGALVIIGQNREQFGFVLFRSEADEARHREMVELELGSIRTVAVDHLVFDLESARELEPARRRALEAIVGKQKRLAIALHVTRFGVDDADVEDALLLCAVAEALAAWAGDPADPDVYEHGGVKLYLPAGDPMVFGIDYFDLPAGEGRDFDALRLLGRICEWCYDAHADVYESEVIERFTFRRASPITSAMTLWPPVLLHEVDGRTLLDLFRDAHPLDPEDERMLAAQLAAWNGIWEVEAVHDDGRLAMVELLTGERRVVTVTAAMRAATTGMYYCMRVIDLDGGSYVSAVDPRALRPGPLGDVLVVLREDLGWPDEPVTPERACALIAQLTVAEHWDVVMTEVGGG